MIVREKDDLDPWQQIGELARRGAKPRRSEERLDSLVRKDGVGEDAYAVNLDEGRRLADPGEGEVFGGDEGLLLLSRGRGSRCRGGSGEMIPAIREVLGGGRRGDGSRVGEGRGEKAEELDEGGGLDGEGGG